MAMTMAAEEQNLGFSQRKRYKKKMNLHDCTSIHSGGQVGGKEHT